MTIKALLKLDVAQLEAMDDATLLAALQPYILPVQRVVKAQKSKVIDTTGSVDRKAASVDKIEAFLAMAKRTMEAKAGKE